MVEKVPLLEVEEYQPRLCDLQWGLESSEEGEVEGGSAGDCIGECPRSCPGGHSGNAWPSIGGAWIAKRGDLQSCPEACGMSAWGGGDPWSCPGMRGVSVLEGRQSLGLSGGAWHECLEGRRSLELSRESWHEHLEGGRSPVVVRRLFPRCSRRTSVTHLFRERGDRGWGSPRAPELMRRVIVVLALMVLSS